MYTANTIYIVGMARASQNNPITHQYGRFIIGFVVDKTTGKIITCDGSFALHATNQFIQTLFIGKTLLVPLEEIWREIESRYYGRSQKAILTAYKDAQEKYICISKGIKVDLSDN